MVAESVFAFGLVAAAVWDLSRRRVPNLLNLAILAAGLGARAAAGGLPALTDGALGAALGLAVLLPPFQARWIGGGDVKLVAAIGAWLGPSGVLVATLVGLALGGLVSLAVLLRADGYTRADVAANLKLSIYTLELPRAPRRQRALLVPLALPLAVAALAVLVHAGGLHA